MANPQILTIEKGRIILLQSEAQGFRTAFHVVFSSFMNKPGCEAWMQEGDAMAVLGTNGSFAIELYLKFLSVIASYDFTTHQGKHIKEHKLGDLYDDLQSKNQSFITDLENEFSHSKYNNGKTLKEFLDSINEYFVEWRYAYSEGELGMNLNTLSDTLRILEDYSTQKFFRVSQDLANIGIGNIPEQTMSYSNSDEIKRH